MGWENDNYVKDARKRNAQDLKDARQSYGQIANERLQNISKGDNFNPWLAMKQFAVEQTQLMPAERGAPDSPGSGWATPGSERRSKTWADAVRAAEAAAEAKKPYVKTFEP